MLINLLSVFKVTQRKKKVKAHQKVSDDTMIYRPLSDQMYSTLTFHTTYRGLFVDINYQLSKVIKKQLWGHFNM